jgi:trk system potassium uptake protein TrkH
MSDHTIRRPGNRVVRRRLDARHVIELEEAPHNEDRPTVTVHAKLFVVAVLVVALVGAGLLMLPWASEEGTGTNFMDALFTSVSAFSVTGLVTLETQAHWSFFGEIVILALIQLGGFGFMVGTSIMLIALGRGTSLRANMMMQDGSPTMTLRDASQLSLKIVRFILLVEAVGAVVLTSHFMRYESFPVSVWWGIFHSVSAFCNAGFDLQGDFGSMNNHNESPVLLMTIAGLIQFGALSYMVVADVWKHRNWKPLHLDTKLVLITNFTLIFVSALLFLVVEWNSSMLQVEPAWKPLNAIFQGVAARTAGFSSADWAMAHDSTLYLWIVIMMVGGAAGSTAGGVKLATIAVIFMAVVSTVRGKPEPQAFGRRIPAQIVFRAISVIALFMAMHFVLSMMLVISEDVLNAEDFSFLSLMFEAMSALATVGLSTGITSILSDGGKLILVIGMFIGRLGPITVAYALQRKQQREHFRYAEANVRIG